MKKIFAFALTIGALFPIAATSATNLTRVRVFSVASAKAGAESINSGASSTSRDHGGGWMTITTEEIGFGKNMQATLLGFSLRQIRSEALCNVGGQAKPCIGRGAIVGYRRTWDAGGREGGNFRYTIFPKEYGQPVQMTFTVR
jgi:hypothetical protein